jgi:hypothetical protein
MFQHVRRAAGVTCPIGEPRPPRLHDLRHTAAAPCRRMVSRRPGRPETASATRHLPRSPRYPIDPALPPNDARALAGGQPAFRRLRAGGRS